MQSACTAFGKAVLLWLSRILLSSSQANIRRRDMVTRAPRCLHSSLIPLGKPGGSRHMHLKGTSPTCLRL